MDSITFQVILENVATTTAEIFDPPGDETYGFISYSLTLCSYQR
jgi:hypothetical protein